jgi:murein DD-endopeptidase MepM/ murein hydrolase activator NlpD
MPCAALFGAASMLLAIILALVPLTLASGGAGGPVQLHLGPDPAGASVLDTNGDTRAVPNRAEVVLNGAHAPVTAPSPRVAPASAPRGAVVSRQGGSSITASRGGALIQGPSSVATWNVRKQLRLAWPLQGAITSGFGWRTHPIFGTKEFHTGIDIAGRSGSPIVAAYWGTVRFVGWKGGYGQVVIVDHGHGFQTSYAHLSATSVKPGQVVEQGQEVGRTGSTGWSTGPHLFFEVYEDGIPRNPFSFLS